jgi:1-acyl-sn-glycerol-3-phosphate acyltransferase
MTAQDPEIPEASHRTYQFPRLGLVEFAFYLLLGIRRSFAADSRRTMRANPPLPTVIGLENVPLQGPFIIVANHYETTTFAMHFAGMAASAAVAQRRPDSPEIRWIMTSEWHGRHIGPIPIPLWLIRWVFGRVALLYGFVSMPRLESDRAGRATAVREAAAIVNPPTVEGGEKRRQGEPIGLMPEATGKGTLIEAMPGTGLFLHMLSRRGVPLLPVGLYEEEGRPTVRFGEPFTLQVERMADRQEQDRLAREQVMVAIGRLLPRHMWGFYASAIAESP